MDEFDGVDVVDVVERVEKMISVTGEGHPSLRSAHFLQPTVTSINGPVSEIPPNCLSSLPLKFEPKSWPLEIKYSGWRNPQKDWETWVRRMASLHESTWNRVGIREAIWSTTSQIPKSNALVLGLAERWCKETKSFVFPWGEATITLEDVLVAGFPVLGCFISQELGSEEMVEIERKLCRVRSELNTSLSKKPSHGQWMNRFMDKGSEIEHEAFLALWLSRFVFPFSYDVIAQSVLPIAVKLSRGIKVALGQAVLASVYRDLGLLKDKIVSLEKDCSGDDVLKVNICSPFQLVQIWACKRMVEFNPETVNVKNGEQRWKKVDFGDVRKILDSAGETFNWRPYTKASENWKLPEFYPEKEMWVSVDSDLSEEMKSFGVCLRVCRLVGIDCEEQYLPHRVGMQFGLDQDLPGCVGGGEDSHCGGKLYIPSRVYDADVTTRYLKWWKRSYSRLAQRSDVGSPSVKKSSKGSLKRKRRKDGLKEGDILRIDSDSSNKSSDQFIRPSKRKAKKKSGSASVRLANKEVLEDLTVPPGFPSIRLANKEVLDLSVPPGFAPKTFSLAPESSVDEDHITIADLVKTIKRQNSDPEKSPSDSEDTVARIIQPKTEVENDKDMAEVENDKDVVDVAGSESADLDGSQGHESRGASKVDCENVAGSESADLEESQGHESRGASNADNENGAGSEAAGNLENSQGHESRGTSEDVPETEPGNMEEIHDHESRGTSEVDKEDVAGSNAVQGQESRATNILEIEIEERISRLEKIFADLKAASRSHWTRNIPVKHGE